MLTKLPFILVALIAGIFFFDPYIPLIVKQVMFSCSMTIKEFIISVLPIIIFGLLFNSTLSLSKGATRIIFLILGLVFVSNSLSTFVAQLIGHGIYAMDLSLVQPDTSAGLAALWDFTLPLHIPNHYAMFAGLVLGIAISYIAPAQGDRFGKILDIVIGKLLKAIALAIPFFITGFVMKLKYDGLLTVIIQDYSMIFVIIGATIFGYIALAFLFLNNLHIKECLRNLKNLVPAMITGFSTMSSAATMPVTLIGVAANARQKELAKSVVPATCNNHMVGDCIAIVICAFAIMKNYGAPLPSMTNFMIFAFYFVVARFSVAGVPGGGVLVALPFMESYLGFNSDMLTLCTALYVLFDPMITVGNILGNAAFAKLIDKVVDHEPEGHVVAA